MPSTRDWRPLRPTPTASTLPPSVLQAALRGRMGTPSPAGAARATLLPLRGHGNRGRPHHPTQARGHERQGEPGGELQAVSLAEDCEIRQPLGESAMIEIPLQGKNGNGLVALVDREDAALVADYGWYVATGYAAATRDGVRIWMHRLIMGIGSSDALEVDHKNLQRLDNRKGNLRICTHALNCQNQPHHRRWTKTGRDSGIRGVHWDSVAGRWKAAVRHRGNLIALGYFDRVEEAGARVSAWRQANLPFSVEGDTTFRKSLNLSTAGRATKPAHTTAGYVRGS